MTNSIYDNIEFKNKSISLQICDLILSPLRVAFKGRTITLINKDEKIYSLAIRILAGIAAAMIFPFTLTTLAIKWWKKEEWQMAPLKSFDPDIILDDEIEGDLDTGNLPADQNDFIKFLAKELSSVQHMDVKLDVPAKGSWRKYGQEHGETNETFNDYIKYSNGECWPESRPLVIQRMGTFAEVDLKIIAITVDFLKIFHNITVHIQESVLTMNDLKEKHLKNRKDLLQQSPQNEEERETKSFMQKRYEDDIDRAETSFPRKNGQYETNFALDCMNTLKTEIEKKNSEECMLISFTNEDLYSIGMTNFVFGTASYGGLGIWSNARFGDPKSSAENFQKCLLRMMKISAHEFGHMRGFPHCTDYDCNIGGYMSLSELDNRPLLYCLQDTAKICFLSHTSLLNYHKKLFNYFQCFNKKYGLNCDLSKDIKTLKGRIAILENQTLNQKEDILKL